MTLPSGGLLSAPGARPATRAQAEAVSRELLEDVGSRLPHVRTAGRVAARLSLLFDADDAELLVAAATLHDIGYSPRISRTGFHPLDGALFLRREGFPERLCGLVAHHSLASMTAHHHGIHDLEEQFPAESSLLVDALAYSDMHSAPDGRETHVEARLADIAHRHSHPGVAPRADGLRASIARVRAALLSVQSHAGAAALVPDPRQRGRVAHRPLPLELAAASRDVTR